jgi:hypothetical protein
MFRELIYVEKGAKPNQGNQKKNPESLLHSNTPREMGRLNPNQGLAIAGMVLEFELQGGLP